MVNEQEQLKDYVKWTKKLNADTINEGIMDHDIEGLMAFIKQENGIGGAVENYPIWATIKDKEISKQWKIAYDAISKIKKVLEKTSPYHIYKQRG